MSKVIQDCPNKQTEEPVQDPDQHWIKFNVLNEFSEPVPDVTVQITLPDGSIEEKTSDKNGMIEILNIDAGECKVEYDLSGSMVERATIVS